MLVTLRISQLLYTNWVYVMKRERGSEVVCLACPVMQTEREREAAGGMPESCRTSLGLQKKNLILCLHMNS